MNQAQSLPLGVGGGLVAIKTLLSRDPCAHATVAIQMIDAILAEHPAQPQQKPVAWCSQCGHKCPQTVNQEPVGWWDAKLGFFDEKHFDQLRPLYTSPPAQEFVCSTGLCHYRKPLPDEQVLDCWKQAYDPGRREHDNATRMARAIEAAHGIKENA